MSTTDVAPAPAPRIRHPRKGGLLALGVGAIGVVFGDIGTSPLYAFQEIFEGAHHIPPVESRVLGAASMVFWTLTLIVSVKYVAIVMRADNNGEGGIVSLATLAQKGTSWKGARRWLMALGILGAALFYGDGMVTPAVSVMSAVEGLGVAKPSLADYVMPITLVVLICLFLVQKHGTAKVGAAFGPIMVMWFVIIGGLGLANILPTPRVLAAINPMYATQFFAGEPMTAFLALGSIVLCVTGAEALYADMGHFGKKPIRVSWFAIAVPALYLNYFGQAAEVLRDPKSADNPFYNMVPDAFQFPMVILATMATVIASQAVITGAFSMTKQAIALDYLPRLQIKHTSDQEKGQVYVPAVNWFLMVAVIVLVVGFRDSSNLASAYGIAVTGTFVITTCLITVVALHKWKVSPWIVWPIFAVFFLIDLSFFVANLTKFKHGGWFPLVTAAVIFTVLMTWRKGRSLMLERLVEYGTPIDDFFPNLPMDQLVRTPGQRIYLTVDVDKVPFALGQQTRMLRILPEEIILLNFETTLAPHSTPDGVIVTNPYPDVTVATVGLGYMDKPDAPAVMAALRDSYGVDVDPDSCVYVVHQVSIEGRRKAPMARWRQSLYSLMQRVAVNPAIYMHLPSDRVLGVWTLIRL